MSLHHRCALAVVLLLAATVSAAEGTYYLPLNGHLHVNVPEGWKASYTPSKGSWDQPTVRLEHADALLTFVPLKADGAAIPADDEVKLLANNSVTPFWKRSTDKNLQFEELKAGDVYGQFGHYTIAKPADGEKPNVTVGLIRLNRVLVTTTIAYTGKDSPAKAAAMEIVKGVTLDVASPLRLMTPDRSYELVVDGKWKASAPKSDFVAKTASADGVDAARNWTVAIAARPAEPKPADAGGSSDHDRARAYFLSILRNDGVKVDDLKESTVAYCSVAEFTVDGKKHALSCYAAGETWLNVHLVKPDFDEKSDRATLDELLNSVLATRQQSNAPGKKKIGTKKEAPPKPAPKKDDDWGAD